MNESHQPALAAGACPCCSSVGWEQARLRCVTGQRKGLEAGKKAGLPTAAARGISRWQNVWFCTTTCYLIQGLAAPEVYIFSLKTFTKKRGVRYHFGQGKIPFDHAANSCRPGQKMELWY